MAEVGGQLRCDGRTLKYETVVGDFELQDTFSERERKGEVLGGGVLCPLICSPQPRSVPSSTLCRSRAVQMSVGRKGRVAER